MRHGQLDLHFPNCIACTRDSATPEPEDQASIERQRVALAGLQTSKGGGGVADTWTTPIALLRCSSDRNGLLVPALCRVCPVSDSAS